tara:strand:+ start:6547 stop:7665 length:1119 start_codon:yes stop_codon:yes gene_type:complete
MNFFFKLYHDWWKNIDKTILFLILLLFSLSLFFSLTSTSLIASDKLQTEDYYYFFKHLIFVLFGLIIIFTFSSLNKIHLLKLSKILFILSLILLFLVPIIGVEVKGSKRWLDFLFLPRFQPIEILKPFFIIMVVSILGSENSKNIYFKYSLSFILVSLIIFLLISQPDIGQSLLIFLTWLSIIFVSGINLYIFSFLFLLMFVFLGTTIIFFPKYQYIIIRLKSFFNPSTGNSYQSDKASEAISSGGFFGKGMGEGILKNTVPEVHTDYVISAISEEFGVAIILLLMTIFLLFSYMVFRKISEEKNNIFKLILFGSIIIILLQFFIHLGVNINLLPTTGMTLPFLSYGGSSIISTSLISGIILNLTRRDFKIR